MTTSQLLTSLQAKCGNESRAILLQYINEVQKFCFSALTAQSTYFSPTTGYPPYLTTTAGTYKYTFPAGTFPVNVLRVHSVLSLNYLGSNASRGTTGIRPTYYIRNQGFYELPCTSKDKNGTNPAELTFLNIDPGTTATNYYLVFSIDPPEITSPSIQLAIPESQHMRVRQAVLSIYRDEKYGDLSAWEYFEEKMAPRIRECMNQGAQGSWKQTPINYKDKEYWYA